MIVKHNRRHRERGLMLVEILIVVAIIALITGGVAVAVIKHFMDAKIKTANSEAAVIRSVVGTWLMLDNGEGCPTVRDLVDSQALDRSARTKDPWGKPYTVRCTEQGVVVISNGRDGMLDTDDDIRAPPKEQG